MEEISTVPRISNIIKNSVGIKIFVIFILILVLLIPTAMIKSLITERETRKSGVIDEISSKWGHAQTITGPVISIPYKKYFEDKNGKMSHSVMYMHFLPERLDIKTDLFPKIRYRGIYKSVLYNTQMELTGNFTTPNFKKLNIARDDIIWSGTSISVGISDMRGIKEQIKATFNNSELSVEPGLDASGIVASGVSSKIDIENESADYSFKFVIDLNGSGKLDFIPMGKITSVSMKSTWPSPSFSGSYLPMERSINDDGFIAKWKILHLNRNYPQHWLGNGYEVSGSAFGVTLFIPVDIYQKSMRTTKYALMFIVFTFMAFFISEIMNPLRVHPIQYLLIGFAITIFYSLLISISEHLSFNIAYIISSASIIVMITGYSRSILKNNKLSAMVGGVLSTLYIFMYFLLQMEDFTLLMGSFGLFVVLGTIMFLTRKIDWYSIKLQGEK